MDAERATATRAVSPEESLDDFQEWANELEQIDLANQKAEKADRAEYDADVAAIDMEMNQRKADQERELQTEIHRYMVKVRAGFDGIVQQLRAARLEQLSWKYTERAKARKQTKDARVLEHYKRVKTMKSRRGQSVSTGSPRHAPATPRLSSPPVRPASHERAPTVTPAPGSAPRTGPESSIERMFQFRPQYVPKPKSSTTLSTPSGRVPLPDSGVPRPSSTPYIDHKAGEKRKAEELSGIGADLKRVRPSELGPPPMSNQFTVDTWNQLNTTNGQSTSRSSPFSTRPFPPPRPKQLDEAFASAPNSRASTPAHAQNTMSFDEVYCGGKPKYYHTIVEFPQGSNKRYILKCEEHQVHFKDNPIAGAAKHLFGAQHPGNNKRHDNAIAELGFLIPDCTAEMAAKNNEMALQAYAAGYKPFNLNRLNRAEKQSLGVPAHDIVSGGHESDVRPDSFGPKPLRPKPAFSPRALEFAKPGGSGEFHGINDPIPGELYLGYWSQTKTRYVVMILPARGDIACAGMHGTIADLCLLRSETPRCYRVDRLRGEILGWAEDYQDGGIYMNRREFPVVYFESKKQVGWLHAKNISPFDFETPHWREIPYFLAARDEYARLKGFVNYSDLKSKRGVPAIALSRHSSPAPASLTYIQRATPPRLLQSSAIPASTAAHGDRNSAAAASPVVATKSIEPPTAVTDQNGKDAKTTDIVETTGDANAEVPTGESVRETETSNNVEGDTVMSAVEPQQDLEDIEEPDTPLSDPPSSPETPCGMSWSPPPSPKAPATAEDSPEIDRPATEEPSTAAGSPITDETPKTPEISSPAPEPVVMDATPETDAASAQSIPKTVETPASEPPKSEPPLVAQQDSRSPGLPPRSGRITRASRSPSVAANGFPSRPVGASPRQRKMTSPRMRKHQPARRASYILAPEPDDEIIEDSISVALPDEPSSSAQQIAEKALTMSAASPPPQNAPEAPMTESALTTVESVATPGPEPVPTAVTTSAPTYTAAPDVAPAATPISTPPAAHISVPPAAPLSTQSAAPLSTPPAAPISTPAAPAAPDSRASSPIRRPLPDKQHTGGAGRKSLPGGRKPSEGVQIPDLRRAPEKRKFSGEPREIQPKRNAFWDILNPRFFDGVRVPGASSSPSTSRASHSTENLPRPSAHTQQSGQGSYMPSPYAPSSSTSRAEAPRPYTAKTYGGPPGPVTGLNGPTPPDSPPSGDHNHDTIGQNGATAKATTTHEQPADSKSTSWRSTLSAAMSSSASTPSSRPSLLGGDLAEKWRAMRAATSPMVNAAEIATAALQRHRSATNSSNGCLSPALASLVKTEPDAEAKDVVLDLAAYSKEAYRGEAEFSYVSGPSKPLLRLATSTEKGVAETMRGSVKVVVRPADVAKLVITQLENGDTQVAVVAKESAGPTQHLTFTKSREAAGSMAGRVQARQFCVWVRSLNPAVGYSWAPGPSTPTAEALASSGTSVRKSVPIQIIVD